jgi:hypothetical protein
MWLKRLPVVLAIQSKSSSSLSTIEALANARFPREVFPVQLNPIKSRCFFIIIYPHFMVTTGLGRTSGAWLSRRLRAATWLAYSFS